MKNDTKYIGAGKPKVGGAIFAAPSGTKLPTDSTSELDPAYISVGYVTSDGVVNNVNRSTENISAWGGDIVLKVQTEFGDEFSFAMLQANDPDVLKVTFGENNVSGTLEEGITLKINSSELPEQVFVVDMVLKDGGTKRLVIPKGSLSMSGEVTYVDNNAVSYPVTIGALPDEAGNTHYEYIRSKYSAD